MCAARHRDIEHFLREQYSKLFALPRSIYLVMLYAIENLLILGVESVLKNLYTAIINTSLSSLTYLLMILGIYRRIDEIRVDTKRLLGISFFSLLPYSLFTPLMLTPIAINRDALIAYAASSAMLFLIRYLFWGDLIKSLAVSVFVGTITSFIGSLNYSMDSLIKYLKISAASSLPIILFILLLEFMGRSNGIKPFELGRGFIRSWMFNENSYLEESLERDSVRGDVKIRSILFIREDRPSIVWVFPGFHFGPFKKVGSSDAVYVFDETLKDLGYTMIFHTTGSHERNIVKREIVEKISRDFKTYIAEHLGKNSVYKGYVSTASSGDGWRIYEVSGEKCSSYIIYNVNGSDDLPHELENEISQMSSDKIIGLADAHSVYSRREINYEGLRETLKRLVNGDTNRSEIIRVGFGEAYIDSECSGVCNKLVKALTIETSGGRDVIVYIYGNNMLKSANERIKSEIAKKGFRNIVIVTPDDHSCAATSIGDPYTAVRYCEDLGKAIIEAVDKSLRDASPTRITCFEKIYRDIPLMGESVWSYIRGLEVLGPLTPKLWIIFLLASSLLMLFI